MLSFSLICINNLSNHIVSIVMQLAADDILSLNARHAKTIACGLNSDLKASLNEHPCVI